MARRKVGKKKKKNRNKKTFGKALDAELREALGGHRARAARKPDHELFFESKSKIMAPVTRRAVVRKLYADKRAAKLAKPSKTFPLIAPHDQPKVAKLAAAISIGACPDEPIRRIDDFGIVKAAVVVKPKETVQEVYDPWAAEEEKEEKEGEEGAEWLEEMNRPEGSLASSAGLGMKRKRRVVVKQGCAAVQVCHPGGSYNPSLDQHQAGLNALVEKELAHRRKKGSNVSHLLEAAEKRIESSSMIDERKEEEEEEEEEEKEEEEKVGGKGREKMREKMTKAERNRQARTREEASRLKERRLQKKFEADLSNATAIHKEVKREERRKKVQLEERKRLVKERLKEKESIPVVRVNGKN